jgi:hypothetical protein
LWLHFWSVACYDLKLSDDAFYALTPRKLDALLKRHKSSLQSTELLYAQIASAVYNTGFRATEKPTSPLDFMPSQWAKKAAKKSAHSDSNAPVRMTNKKRKALCSSLNSVLSTLARKA